MTEATLEVLRQRVTRLDAPVPSTGASADPRLVHFTLTMQFFTNTQMAHSAGFPAVLDPREADAEIARSGLLAELRSAERALVTGPLDPSRQIWTGTARHRSENREPRPGLLIKPAAAGQAPAVTPWSGGLFTSTASRLGPSMWRIYLDLYHGSDLFPLPWRSWELPACGQVTEITGAVEWAAFVERYPLHHDGLVYPDWDAAARETDGIHVTLQAIAASQGFSFPTSHGLTAPGFWDVEQTYWLRWAFATPRLMEVTY